MNLLHYRVVQFYFTQLDKITLFYDGNNTSGSSGIHKMHRYQKRLFINFYCKIVF